MTFQAPGPVEPNPTEPVGFATVEPGPVTVRPLTPSRRGTSLLNLALGLAVLVAIGGVAFAVGRSTAPAAAAATGRNFGNGAFQGGGEFPAGGGNGGHGGAAGRGFGGGGGLSVQGTVTAIGADSITIKTANGQTIVLSTSASTAYHRETNASAGDVQSGTTVIVRVGRAGGANGGASSAPSGGTAGQAGPLNASDITVVPGS